MSTAIYPKLASTLYCPVLKCISCDLASAKKCNQIVWEQVIKEKSFLALEKYQACDFVSIDWFDVIITCQLLTYYGWEGDNNQFHGGKIFNDAATGATGL